MRALVTAVLVALSLSGCLGDSGSSLLPSSLSDGGDAAPPAASLAGRFNLTTPFAAAVPYVRDLTGTVPTGTLPSPSDFCCAFVTIPAQDALVDGPVQVRLTLTWTNDAANQANLDLAACMPYYCGFDEQPDQSTQTGAHTETMTFVTGRFAWYEDDYFVGVRQSGAVITSGLPFTIRLEAVPLERGLSGDSFAVTIPEGANLTAELLGPLTEGEMGPLVLIGDAEGRPYRWMELKGTNGTLLPLGLAPGNWVVTLSGFGGGTIRLHLDREPESPELPLLAREFESVVVADLTSPAPATGTFEHTASPWTVSLFPWFVYGDGPQAQPPTGQVRQYTKVESSGGLVAESSQSRLGVRAAGGQECLWCNGFGDFDGSKLVDDDGKYLVTYDGAGVVGQFMLYADRHAPPPWA